MHVSDLYLEYQCALGWARKMKMGLIPRDRITEYGERLKMELDIFARAGISDYFLILQGVMNWCYEQNLPVGPGRGSAAGCLVSWLIDITMVDPLKYGLIFERFYNPGRLETRELPDIDIDVSQENRDRVINEYIIPTYGRENVAPIIAFGTLQPKGAIKDIGRALGVPVFDTEAMSNLLAVRRGTAMNIKETLAETNDDGTPTVNAKKLQAYKEKYPDLFKWAELVEDQDLTRTKSIHASAIIICPEPVGNVVPLEWNASKKLACTGFDMHTDPTGLLKLDLLGLRNTDVLKNTMERLGVTERYRDVLARIPLDDEYVWSQLGAGKSKGVFQMESHFMRSILIDVKPTDMEDLAAINALGRPGPLDAQIDVTDDICWENNGLPADHNMPEFLRKKRKTLKGEQERVTLNMIEVYAARRAGALRVSYLHPKLEPILKNTQGVITYQEQCMEIAKQLAGYTLAEADGLRKAIGKKIAEKMAANHAKFVEGCIMNAIEEETAEAIWNQMETFAGYGFNKSHAVAYAVMAYWTAYYKFRHPAPYMAALISSTDDIEQIKVWIEDARDTLGLEIEPPDINESGAGFTANGAKLLFGLQQIKGVGTKAVNHLLRIRQGLPFAGLKDFYTRIDLGIMDSGVMKAIIASGAFLRYGYNKPTMLEMDAQIRDRRGKSATKTKTRGEKIAKLNAIINNNDTSKMAKKFKGDTQAYFDSLREEIRAAELEIQELASQDGWFTGLKAMPDIRLEESLAMEEEVLGCAVSGNIATPYKALIETYSTHTTSDAKDPDGAGTFILCGVLSDTRTHVIKSGKNKGQEMAYAKLTDTCGVIEFMLFPQQFGKFSHLLIPGKVVQIKVRRMDDGESFNASAVNDLEELFQRQASAAQRK